MLSILYLIISQMQQSLFIYDCFCLFDYFPSVRIRFLSSGIFSEPHKPKFTFLKFNPSELKFPQHSSPNMSPKPESALPPAVLLNYM